MKDDTNPVIVNSPSVSSPKVRSPKVSGNSKSILDNVLEFAGMGGGSPIA